MDALDALLSILGVFTALVLLSLFVPVNMVPAPLQPMYQMIITPFKDFMAFFGLRL